MDYMVICFVSSHRLRDIQRLDFVGNIPIRLANVLGDEAEIHLLYNGGEISKRLIENGISLHEYGMEETGWMSRVFNLFMTPYITYRICKKEKVDIVINLSNHYYFFIPCIGARLAKCKCVARVVGILPYSKSLPWRKKMKKKAGMILEKISLLSSNHIICLSEDLKNMLITRGDNGKKISVISQGLNTQIFRPRNIEAIKKKPKRFLFVGRLVSTKGVEDGIRAFLEVKKEYPEIELVICGDGPEKKRLERLYGSSKGLTFKGFLPMEQFAKVYENCDVLLLPSYSEGLPNVVMEAMASMVPVIASGVGSLRELLAEERGVFVSPGNVEEIAGAIKKMIEDQSLRLSCTEKALDYVKNNHSFEAVRDSTLRLFRMYSTKERDNYSRNDYKRKSA